MKLLAVNTAGANTQIALTINDNQYLENAGFSRHSETLFPLLDKMLQENKVLVSDLDAIACVIGPGSFTGIRIGMSVAKGFAFAKNKPLIAINSMELLASEILDKPTNKPICAVINAGADLVYHQTFLRKNTEFGTILKPLNSPRLDKIKHFCGYLHSNFNDEVDLIYNNNNDKNRSFADLLGENVDYKVENLARITKYKFTTKDFTDAINIAPLYLRASQAEQNLQNLQIKKATIEDLPDILKLETQDDDWDLKWSEISIRQSFENPDYRCFIAYDNVEVKGFISLNLLSGEAEILRVVVFKNARLQGIASKMIDLLVEKLKAIDFHTLFLEVNDQNYPAISLYQKKGFVEVGRREDYYERGEDAILLRLDF